MRVWGFAVHFRGLGTLQVLVKAGFEGLVTAIFKVFFGFRGLFLVGRGFEKVSLSCHKGSMRIP